MQPPIHQTDRRAWRWLIVSAPLLVTLLVGSARPADAQTVPAVSPDFAAVDRYVEAEMDAIGIPGVALAIVHGNQIVHLQGFGVADPSGRAVTPQTPFNIGSMAKAMTALAIMQLVEAGTVDLATPAQRYLPWFRVADPAASARITVQDLLNHTSGLSEAVGNDYPAKHDTRDTALETRVRALSSVQLNRAVGTTREYSNANYDTLGLIVQVVSGQPYETYIQQHIFTPLAMHHSFPSRREAEPHGAATGYRQWFGVPVPFREPVPRSHLPSGRQFSTAEDMAHLLLAYLNGGQYGSISVLSAAGIRAIAHIGMGGDDANFKARAILAPDTQWGLVLLMNTQAVGLNGPRQEQIKDGVYRLLLGQQPVMGAPHNITVVVGLGLITLVTAVLVLRMVRSLVLLRRWRARPERRPRGWLRVGWHVAVPLVSEMLWVLFLVGVVQVAAGSRSSRPLRFMLEHVPDLGWMIVVSATLALGWGVLRTLLAIWVVRMPRAPQHRARPTMDPLHG
jgi:CubicO group peptidase (beta-lactamase class C family)